MKIHKRPRDRLICFHTTAEFRLPGRFGACRARYPLAEKTIFEGSIALLEYESSLRQDAFYQAVRHGIKKHILCQAEMVREKPGCMESRSHKQLSPGICRCGANEDNRIFFDFTRYLERKATDV